ncbi:MAG TPA: Mur ligase family protein [Thermoanaerobaculia bacterium]|nr:Mur ligase family protein [Thermoanaerobaculia bacterium]
MEILESRRLTGPNLLLQDREGAILDVVFNPGEDEAVLAAWERHARRLLDAVGWSAETTAVRRFSGGASLAISAPFDALYAATDVNEQAWEAALAEINEISGRPGPHPGETAARLRETIARESNPALRALRDTAEAQGVAFFTGEELATVGLGQGSLTFPTDAVPDPASIDWSQVHDVPVVLVTGTNGKSTTVRLLASIVRAAGLTAGTTSTDRVEVGDEVVDRGDFSGPSGARTLLRDRRVEVAILETARGGILRRGLAVRRADVALVTNIAEDHLGDYGVQDLDSLAQAKLVVTRAIGAGGRVVLNAEDPRLTARAGGLTSPITWFSLDPERVAGGDAAFLEGDELVLQQGGQRLRIVRVQDVPIAFGGAARYNIANALAAIAVAAALDLPAAAIADGLRQFRPTPEENPGRANLLEIGGVRILLDYAHNPHGLAALLDLAATLPASRRLIVLGQAGDRDEAAIRTLARTAWTFRPDRVVIKEIPTMLRGRAPGEIPALLEDELRRQGAPPGSLERAEDDLEAARQALAWARPGDLLVLLIHTQRDEVLDLLRRLRDG